MLIRSVLDLRDDVIDVVLRRAAEHKAMLQAPWLERTTIVGLAFFSTSLRTRVGFAAAAARLGVTAVEVTGRRASETSMPESVDDTMRTLAGYAEVIVARFDRALTQLPHGVSVPVLNGGDVGPAAEHPSQALIDLFAIGQLPRPLPELTVALCGDLRMRAVRSLLLLMTRRPPARLILVSEPELLDGFELPEVLRPITEHRALTQVGEVNVLYVAGVPHGALHEDGRTRLRVTNAVLDLLAPGGVALSPLPLIDEIESHAVTHDRWQAFQQSDDGLFVRMAILEFLLAPRSADFQDAS